VSQYAGAHGAHGAPEGTGLSDFLTADCIRRLAITGVMSEMS
jgi:hypothetical protein